MGQVPTGIIDTFLSCTRRSCRHSAHSLLIHPQAHCLHCNGLPRSPRKSSLVNPFVGHPLTASQAVHRQPLTRHVLHPPPPAIAHTVSSMGLSSASCSPATTSTCMAMRRHAFQLASPPQSTCAPLRTPAHSGSETHSVSTRNHPGQPVCAPLLKISSYRQRQRASVHHATAARAHTSQQLAHGLSPSAMCMSDLICCPRRLRQPAHTPCMRCQYVTTRSVSRWVVPSACFVA